MSGELWPRARPVVIAMEEGLRRYLPNSDRAWRLKVAGHLFSKICDAGVNVFDEETGHVFGDPRAEELRNRIIHILPAVEDDGHPTLGRLIRELLSAPRDELSRETGSQSPTPTKDQSL